MHVALATGRRYSRALPLVEPLGLHLPLITASGALIKDPVGHATLFRAEFGPGVLEALLAPWSEPGTTQCCTRIRLPRGLIIIARGST